MVSEVNHSIRDLTAVEATSQFKETEIGSIPVDWELVALGEAAAYTKVSMNPQRHPDEDFDYYSIPAYQVSSNPFVERGSQIRSQKLLVDQGVVLFGKLNPRVPKVWRVTSASGRRRIASTEFIPLSPVDGKICSDFLYYLAWSDYILPRSQELVSGSTPSRQRVDVKAFLRLPIPLPPLPEQRAIEATEAVIAAARELERSLMRHLFTYGPVPLQEAERVPLKETEVGPVPQHWEVARLSDVMRTRVQNGAFIRRERFGDGVPFLNVADTYRSTTVDCRVLQRVRCSSEELKRFILQSGDLVFVRSSLKREGLGQCILVEELGEPTIYDCHLMRVALDVSRAVPKFLVYYFLGPVGKQALIARSKTTTMTTINQSGLSSVLVPLPRLGEQKAVATLLARTEHKIQAEEQRKWALDSLFKSLLHHLMTGKIRVKPEAAFEETGQ